MSDGGSDSYKRWQSALVSDDGDGVIVMAVTRDGGGVA